MGETQALVLHGAKDLRFVPIFQIEDYIVLSDPFDF